MDYVIHTHGLFVTHIYIYILVLYTHTHVRKINGLVFKVRYANGPFPTHATSGELENVSVTQVLVMSW